LLCRECHQWCHDHPTAAFKEGFMVSRYVERPGEVAVETWYGVLYLLCDGDIEFKINDERSNDERDTERTDPPTGT
jgi:hypothetical protein